MQENNNIKNERSLGELTDTIDNSSEQGALKDIHRGYNKLSGFEAMLHIVKRYRIVLYPFILLSVIGSTYSFYNDFLKAFPMLSSAVNLTIAFFFSIMLEIVRDASLIALFNSKMKIFSRGLVSVIFLGVTIYLYSAHLEAIKVIEEMAIEYTLKNQTEEEIKTVNPAYEIAVKELKTLENKLELKRAEKTNQLIQNSTSIHVKKRNDALNRIEKIDNKVEEIEGEISAKNQEILKHKNDNIKDVEDSQKLISNILLATLILVESLAMLGAVIKFIHTDNAKKEIAKHSEIIEEYVEISEQMKRDNEQLTKNLSHVVKGQSESNQRVMKMISEDMQQTATLNMQFIEQIAENKRQIMRQMNDMLQMFSTMQSMGNIQQPTPPKMEKSETRQIGFKALNEIEKVEKLWNHGKVEEGQKLVSKTALIDVKNRQENQAMTDFYKRLEEFDIVEFRRGVGYFAKADYDTAISLVS